VLRELSLHVNLEDTKESNRVTCTDYDNNNNSQRMYIILRLIVNRNVSP